VYDPSLTHAIPEHLRDESLVIKRYRNPVNLLCFILFYCCSGRDDEQKYQDFIKDVTSDILRSGIYTNRSEKLLLVVVFEFGFALIFLLQPCPQLCLIHLFLCLSLFLHVLIHHCHHLQLPLSFTLSLKPTCSTSPSHHRLFLPHD